MASLVMTIDSSDEEEQNKEPIIENIKSEGKKETKKIKKAAPAKQTRPAEAEDEGDLMMATKEEGDPANALFLESSGDDSDGATVFKRADGGKGTKWNFRQQLVVASAASKPG